MLGPLTTFIEGRYMLVPLITFYVGRDEVTLGQWGAMATPKVQKIP